MKQDDVGALEAFKNWFLSPSGPGLLHIPLHQPTFHKNGMTAITLYRRNGYQAELCLLTPGRRHDLVVREGSCLGTVFLGGSLNYGTLAITGLPDGTPRFPSPDDYRRDMTSQARQQHPAALERPHPVLERKTNPTFIPLPGGSRTDLHATEEDGLILLFSFYDHENGKTSSGLDHVRSETE